MRGSPWSVLGLDGPADEQTIRRAYAARLKTVRPDVDPVGFQRLVQARDFALRVTRALPVRLPQGPTASPNLVPMPDERAVPDETPPPESPPDHSPPGTSAPVIIDIEPSKPPPPVDTEQEPQRSEPRLGRPLTEAADPDVVSQLLSAFVTAWTGGAALPPVAPILKAVSEQSLVARQKLEVEALRAVTRLLDNRLFDRKEPASRQAAARTLIVGLDDEYAWTLNDRRLHEMTPFQGAADQTARLLRIVREWHRTGLRPNLAPPRRKQASNWLTTLGLVVLVSIGMRAFNSVSSSKFSNPAMPAFTAPSPAPRTYGLAPGPDQAAVVFNRGVAFDNAGNVSEAITAYDEAVRLNPNYALAFYNRGLAYASKGQFDRAIADYDQAIRLNPTNPDGFVSRGVAFDAKGDYRRAIQDYDEAIRQKPSYGLALVNRGIAHANAEEYDKAIRDYDQAIRLDPNDRDALRYRGEAKRASGDTSGGDADIAKANQLASSPSTTAPKPGK